MSGGEAQDQPALEALRAAVLAHEDATARRILQRLALRDPGPRTRELMAAFERILEGRALVRRLELSLEAVANPNGEGFELWLVARNRGHETLQLAPGPATLRIHQLVIAPRGADQRQVRTSHLAASELPEVEPGGTARVRLGESRPGFPSGALAVRCRWEIHARSGRIDREGASLPAMGLKVEPAEWTALAPFLPKETVEPYELVRYIARRRIAMPPLLERTVRIAPERREEALDLLTPHVRRMSQVELQQVVPALRWLADDPRLSGDPLVWKQWVERRAARRSSDQNDPLDMPGAPVEESGLGQPLDDR